MSVDWSSPTETRLTEDTPINSNKYGNAVGINGAGDRMVIGVKGDNSETGRIRIYEYDGDTWSEMASFTGASSGDQFGSSVAMSSDGDYIVVGAIGVSSHRGEVYVYKYATGSWSLDGTLTAFSAGVGLGAEFGNKVDIDADGNTIIIGAHLDNSDAGSVQIFTHNGSVWGHEAEIYSGQTNQKWGIDVAIDDAGEVAIASSIERNADAGGVIVFEKGNDWTSTTDTDLHLVSGLSPSLGNSDQFGYSIDIDPSGGYIAVGARWDDDTQTNAGRVYVFDNDGGWDQLQSFQASTPEASAFYGDGGVALSNNGTVLAVGSSRKNDGFSNQGAVYTYTLDSGSYGSESIIYGSGGAELNQQLTAEGALAISSDGSRVVAGALNEDPNGQSAGGATYVFDAVVGVGGGGDPHIVPFEGESFDLPHDDGTYLLFDNQNEEQRVQVKAKLVQKGKHSFFGYIKIESPSGDQIIDVRTGDLTFCEFTNQKKLDKFRLKAVSDPYPRRMKHHPVVWKKGASRMGNTILIPVLQNLKVRITNYSRHIAQVEVSASRQVFQRARGALVRNEIIPVDF